MMNRTSLYAIVSADIGDGSLINELDFLDNNMQQFVTTRDPLYYRVTQSDINVPDLVSYRVYQEERYWWFLCLLNNINDCSVDMAVGQFWTIPDLLDIYDYYKMNRKR